MGKFENILIFSDIDGTYLDENRTIVPKNEEAIRRFMREGGTFTVATGRMERNTPGAIPNIAELANFPALLNNGTCVYDFREDRSIKNFFMEPETVKPLLDFVAVHYPDVGIRVTIPGGFVYPFDHPKILHDIGRNSRITRKLPPSEWDLSCLYKIVFRAESEVLKRMQADLTPIFADKIEIILSEVEILEVQRKGVSKGSTINLIREDLRRSGTPKRIVCIGDYENDLEMLRAADFAACPENALDSVKAVSDVVLCHCREGVIADLIEYLESHPALLS